MRQTKRRKLSEKKNNGRAAKKNNRRAAKKNHKGRNNRDRQTERARWVKGGEEQEREGVRRNNRQSKKLPQT